MDRRGYFNQHKLNKTKVLFLAPLPPPVHGVSLLSDFLLKSEAIGKEFQLESLKTNFSTEIKAVGKFGLGKVYDFIKFFSRVSNRLKINHYPLIYFCVSSSGLALLRDILLVLFLLKRYNSKLIFHLHGKHFIKYKGNRWVALLLKKTFYKVYIIQHSKLLMPYAEWFATDTGGWYFLPNGIPEIISDNELSETLVARNKKESPPIILFLSNMILEKGPMVLVEVLKILKERENFFKCIFVGAWFHDLKPETFFKTINNYGLEKWVEYKGPLYEKAKYEVLQMSDIFVFPTLNESFGNVALEAMQFGLPVVASSEGSLPEIIDDGLNGFLVEKNNPLALAEKIETLLKDKDLRRKMGEEGRRTFREKYTCDIYEKNIKEIFEKIADSQ